MNSRFISIGMPVYNGGETLRRALDCLLGQTHANFELIISDNASTDKLTRSITEEYAQRDSRIRLTRQPTNQGAFENFLWVLEQARAEFFLWAAHDDFWSSNYLEVLTRCLEESPEAVLATPTSHAVVTKRNGESSLLVVPPAPNADRAATLRAYVQEEKCCLWIYGMYRTKWLKGAAPEWKTYPWFSGDVIWLWGVVLTEQLVGDSEATFYYTADHRLRKKQSYRQTVETWGAVYYHMVRLCWQRLPAAERFSGFLNATEYVYRHYLYRGNVLLTAVRVLKKTALWCMIAVEASLKRSVQRCITFLNQWFDRSSTNSLPPRSTAGHQETQHAA